MFKDYVSKLVAVHFASSLFSLGRENTIEIKCPCLEKWTKQFSKALDHVLHTLNAVN